ncbi:MAG: RagB/SusD family nutrient uptake outer membrane protein [Mucilaginibacter sp.]|uniref:RagB/SusD family nutrient uptake outer membrane protein n=1 Tax=Mucilaginibacter sp. TaxID=1882438 RepID=UPI003267B5BA
MKINHIFKISAVLLLLSQASCKKDFLDRTPGVSLPEDAVFSDPVQTSQFANNAYNFLVDDYVRFNDHRGTTSQASDEAVSGNLDPSVYLLNQGLFNDYSEKTPTLNDIVDIWNREYQGIRITNQVLAAIPNITWPSAYSPTRIEGEMHFLRAFFYFELIKRFGGVPIIDKVYGVNDNVDFPRASYDDCVKFIVADLDKAEQQLPEDYDASNYGRATLGAARALRARTLLYAASPLSNPTNDLTKWQKAADAANVIITSGKYQLQTTYNDILNVASSPEYIMTKVRAARINTDGKIIDFAMSPGSGGANGQMNPTQNHVDLYEMLNGKAITDATSGYNPQAPYTNRDPRLTANVIYNDETYQGRKIGMWSQTATNGSITYGLDFNPTNVIYTATRYYCRKMWPEAYVRNTSGTALINYVFFRYAEILLDYAEAKNEAVTTPGSDVYSAVNLVRQRMHVGDVLTNPTMPGLPAGLTQSQMRDAIRHERAIELAFEDQRWYDIMRWKAGIDIVAQPVYGMNVVKNTNGTFTYTKVLLSNAYQKTFKDYMHRYPIPRQEVYKSAGNLVQNPGW